MELTKILKDKIEEQSTLVNAAVEGSRSMADEELVKYNALTAEIKNLQSTVDAAKEQEEREAKSKQAVNQPIYAQPKNPANEKPFNSLGEQLAAVIRVSKFGENDNRLNILNQLGLNEGVPSEGGFLVQTDFVTELLKRTYEVGVLASRVRKIPVSANANGLTMNAIAETSRATGSRWGGVQSYWLHEAGTKTPSDPTFRQIELKLKKLIGLCYATDELLQDTSALESIISQAFSEDFAWMVDNAIFRGTGAGQPLGITGHPATIPVAAEANQPAATIQYQNIVKMWSRMWARSRANAIWAINQDIEPQLFTMSLAVGVGGVPVYLPAGGASASPYGTLFGRPVVPIEHASTLGTIGDISLLDLSQYLMIDKGGIQSASSIHVQFTTDQSAFRFVYRCDGQPMWNLPLTPANGTNTLSPFVQLATRP